MEPRGPAAQSRHAAVLCPISFTSASAASTCVVAGWDSLNLPGQTTTTSSNVCLRFPTLLVRSDCMRSRTSLRNRGIPSAKQDKLDGHLWRKLPTTVGMRVRLTLESPTLLHVASPRHHGLWCAVSARANCSWHVASHSALALAR